MTALAQLLEDLRSRDSQVRSAACAALATSSEDGLTPAMLGLLDDPYGFVVKQALEVLCLRPDQSALERLARFVEEDNRLDLVWLARIASAAADGSKTAASPTRDVLRGLYGPSAVIEALLWPCQESVPVGDGLVLALMPSSGAEVVLTVEAEYAVVHMASKSIWQSLEDGGGWSVGSVATTLTTDPALASELAEAIEEAFSGTCDSVVLDGIVAGGHRVVGGIHTELSRRNLLGVGGRLLGLLRHLGMSAARDTDDFEWFQDLGYYLELPPEIIQLEQPSRALALWGSFGDEDIPGLTAAGQSGPAVALVDMRRARFLAPGRRTEVLAWLKRLDCPVLVNDENPYHPTVDDSQRVVTLSDESGYRRGLLRIGYWGSDTYPDYPDPKALVGEPLGPEDAAFADRLDAGVVLIYFMGYSPCRICGQQNGAAELTDGVFLWPEGLSHYVREHGVKLPAEVSSRLSAVPDGPQGRWLLPLLCDPREADLDYWLDVTRGSRRP